MTSRFVTSTDGTRLALHESGNPDGPVVVAVHGFPDNHHVWDGVGAEIGDRFRVIAYDVRGAGESDKPRGKRAYRQQQLTDDLVAVVDAVSPDAPVHLLAHDWGSMQSWDAVSDPALAARFASFTSISGPSLQYSGVWMGDRKNARTTARQLLRSYYMFLFQLPVLPEWLMSLKPVERGISRVELLGRTDAGTAAPVPRGVAERTNGINIYRANALSQVLRPKPSRTLVPTLVLAPSDDPFVMLRIATEAPLAWVDDLTVVEIPGSHWVVTARPELVAMHLAAFIDEKAPKVPAPTKRRAYRDRLDETR